MRGYPGSTNSPERIADGNELDLAERASKIKWRVNDCSSPLLEYGEENIDPFSFFYTVATHCRGPEGRARVLGSVATVFNLKSKLPLSVDDAFYFPQGTPQTRSSISAERGIPGCCGICFGTQSGVSTRCPGKPSAMPCRSETWAQRS